MICKHASTMLNCFISTQHFNYLNVFKRYEESATDFKGYNKKTHHVSADPILSDVVSVFILRFCVYLYTFLFSMCQKHRHLFVCPQTTTQGGSHSMTCTIPLTSLTNHTANIVYNLFIRVWENITHNPSLSLSILISLFLFSDNERNMSTRYIQAYIHRIHTSVHVHEM